MADGHQLVLPLASRSSSELAPGCSSAARWAWMFARRSLRVLSSAHPAAAASARTVRGNCRTARDMGRHDTGLGFKEKPVFEAVFELVLEAGLRVRAAPGRRRLEP